MSLMERGTYDYFSKIPLSDKFIVPFSVVIINNTDEQCPYPNDTIMWWNGIQIGLNNRLTQIVTQAYSTRPGHNEVWVRNKHDDTWSVWTKI